MPKILIITSSVRTGRKSPRVSFYFKKLIEENKLADAEIMDLKEYQFPVFDERLQYQENPSEKVIEAALKIKNANGVLIVTPEYNGGYPASLKNLIDLLIEEWHHKPIAISTVSSGAFGGSQVIVTLQYTLWKLHALVAPVTFPVPQVHETFDENGIPRDKEKTDKRALKFVNELLWVIEACRKMQS
jgi:NAD(P)H-dependent FMN reductase